MSWDFADKYKNEVYSSCWKTKYNYPDSTGCTKTQIYRLVKIIQEATRLLAVYHGLIAKGVDCERKHQYRTIGALRATCLALRYRIQYYDEFWLLEC